jgi:beta-lactamase class A
MVFRTIFFFAAILFPSLIVMGETSTTSAAQAIGAQVTSHPKISTEMFAPVFLAAETPEQLAALLKSVYAKNGAVTQVIPREQSSAYAGEFDFVFSKATMRVTVSLEKSPPHRMDGLWLKPAAARLVSLDQATAKLAALPGSVSFQVMRLDDLKMLAGQHADKPLAIGSAFKLYILAELLREKMPWDRVVKIESRLKSLPSGEMQNWPDDSPVTVHTLAIQMISKSDNTATDHLLALVGHAQVEAALPELGMKAAAGNVPFLSTRQAFLLKADGDLRKKYLGKDAAGRAALLDQMSSLPKLDEFPDGPTAIDSIEWFASAADLCRLLQWFDQTNDATANAILTMNPGLSVRRDQYDFIGFKGGSEAGVLSLNWLLKSRNGHRYALSAIWNNPNAAGQLDLDEFSSLMLGITDLLAQEK